MTREALVELTAALTAIPSHEDEDRAGEFLVDWLRRETAADVRRDDVGNVFATVGTGGPTLALVGHHDVVEPDDSQVRRGEYVVEERNGRIHGRGAADMKGALAAMLLALRDADPAAEITFASFVGEEVGGEGARAAIEDGFVPEYAVVGEGSASYSADGVLDVAVAHKGRRGSTVVATGTSAHASEPEKGKNAVYRAADAVDVVRDLEVPETTAFGTAVAGSVAVTGIEGGRAWNVIPDRCTVTVDERTVPGERADLDRVEAIDGVTWRVDQDLPPMRCDDPRFADAVLDAAASGQAGEPEHVVKPHATDAGWLAQAGSTCVVCGPAEPGEAHTATESVSIGMLERAYETYLALADEWPGAVTDEGKTGDR